jgi:hypothetical protein
VEEMMEAQQLVQPYKDIKKALTAARGKYRTLEAALVKRLEEARAKLSKKDDCEMVLDLVREGMVRHMDRYVHEHREQAMTIMERSWDKYAAPLGTIERDRKAANERMAKLVEGLGYV